MPTSNFPALLEVGQLVSGSPPQNKLQAHNISAPRRPHESLQIIELFLGVFCVLSVKSTAKIIPAEVKQCFNGVIVK